MIQILILFAAYIRKAVQIVPDQVELGVILPNSSVMGLNVTLTVPHRVGFIVGMRHLSIPQVSFLKIQIFLYQKITVVIVPKFLNLK